MQSQISPRLDLAALLTPGSDSRRAGPPTSTGPSSLAAASSVRRGFPEGPLLPLYMRSALFEPLQFALSISEGVLSGHVSAPRRPDGQSGAFPELEMRRA
jgi:hypothetical protein